MNEVEFIVDLISKEQNKQSINSLPSKIVLCGSWSDISPTLDYAVNVKSHDINFSTLIIATTDLDKFITKYFNQFHMRLVDWSEDEYEEILIEHVKPKSDQFTINLVIEFQPTHRRLRRIREILEKDGILVIPKENPMWRSLFPDLMNSFTSDHGTLVKLVETVDDSRFACQLKKLLGEKQPVIRPYFKCEYTHFKLPSSSTATEAFKHR